MTDELLDCVEVEPRGEARYSVIWLHGLGADGHDFEPIVPELRLPFQDQVRFIFPHAPMRAITINAGMHMRAWYDIVGLTREDAEDEQGVRASAEQVIQLIQRENQRGIPAERLILAGFSQGGAIALHTALRYPERLAGIMALSTYIPIAGTLERERSPANQDTPIFMAHGTYDQVLPFEMGSQSKFYLDRLGYDVAWHEYPMQHQVCYEEIEAISQWMQRVLTPA